MMDVLELGNVLIEMHDSRRDALAKSNAIVKGGEDLTWCLNPVRLAFSLDELLNFIEIGEPL